MTYGEAWYQSKLKVTLQDDERSLRVKEKRMKWKEASKYYNAKLFKHFVEDYSYDERLTRKQIEGIVSALMFGERKRYLEFVVKKV